MVVLDTKYEPKLVEDEQRCSMKDFVQNYDFKLLKFQASDPKIDESIIGSSE